MTITPKLSGLKHGKHLLSLKVSREEFGSGLARWFWLEVSYHFAPEMSAWAAVLLLKVVHSILENRVVVAGHWWWGEEVDYSGAVRGHLGVVELVWSLIWLPGCMCLFVKTHITLSKERVGRVACQLQKPNKRRKKMWVTHMLVGGLCFSPCGPLSGVLKVLVLWPWLPTEPQVKAIFSRMLQGHMASLPSPSVG